MKYRIILEESGNGKHYEVQFYERCWYGHKWVNTKKYHNSGYDEYYIKHRYDTLEEALHVVNAYAIKRTVISHGVIEHGVVYERRKF